jgi:hypothetical protein
MVCAVLGLCLGCAWVVLGLCLGCVGVLCHTLPSKTSLVFFDQRIEFHAPIAPFLAPQAKARPPQRRSLRCPSLPFPTVEASVGPQRYVGWRDPLNGAPRLQKHRVLGEAWRTAANVVKGAVASIIGHCLRWGHDLVPGGGGGNVGEGSTDTCHAEVHTDTCHAEVHTEA